MTMIMGLPRLHLPLALAPFLALAQPASAELRAHFIDVGQGDAILLEAPEATVMIDAGWDNGKALSYLRELGIERIDIVVGTHAHADHIGGFTEILPEIPVAEVWYNGQTHTTQTFERFVDAVIESGAQYHEPARGERIELGRLEIEVLHPRGSAADHDGHLHDYNIVLRASYGEVSLMLTGDAEIELEHELIAAGLDLDATVLKLGHHGSRTSTSPEFVAAVRPQIAVNQAGQDNRYGHPHPEPLEALAKAGVEVFGTDVHGTIVMTSDGRTLEIAVARTREARVTTPGAVKDRAEAAAADQEQVERSAMVSDCIDLNSASSEELIEIAHIGDTRAAAVIANRPWQSLRELTRIRGIGEARLQDIKAQQLACVQP